MVRMNRLRDVQLIYEKNINLIHEFSIIINMKDTIKFLRDYHIIDLWIFITFFKVLLYPA
jgi:hypothetical protein